MPWTIVASDLRVSPQATVENVSIERYGNRSSLPSRLMLSFRYKNAV